MSDSSLDEVHFVRVGILGLGRMGKLHFLNALRMNDVNVAAISDKNNLRLRRARKLCNHVNIYDDYKKMIDSENLDSVIISLPNSLKEESVVRASEKGLDIFVDKPLGRNSSEARRIIKEVRKNGVRLLVGVNYRFFDSVQKLKWRLDDGQIGNVGIATLELIMNGPFSHPLLPQPIPDWWLDKEKSGGGVVLDLGYHLLDLCNWMFGDLQLLYSVLERRMNLPVEDSATLILKSSRTGVRCVVNIGWFSKMIFPNFNFRVSLHGANGYLSTDQFAPRNLYLHAAKEAIFNLTRRIIRRRVHLLSYTYYYSSFASILQLFFDSVRNEEPFPISLQEQLDVLEIINKIYNQNRLS